MLIQIPQCHSPQHLDDVADLLPSQCHLPEQSHLLKHLGELADLLPSQCHLPKQSHLLKHLGDLADLLPSQCYLPEQSHLLKHPGDVADLLLSQCHLPEQSNLFKRLGNVADLLPFQCHLPEQSHRLKHLGNVADLLALPVNIPPRVPVGVQLVGLGRGRQLHPFASSTCRHLSILAIFWSLHFSRRMQRSEMSSMLDWRRKKWVIVPDARSGGSTWILLRMESAGVVIVKMTKSNPGSLICTLHKITWILVQCQSVSQSPFPLRRW